MWEYVLGGATVFGLIVAASYWIRGRLVRKALMQYFERMEGEVKKPSF